MTFKSKNRPKVCSPKRQITNYLKPKTNGLLAYALPTFAIFLVAGSVMAGTNNSFGGALAQISQYLEGSLGQLLAVASLIAGLVAMVIFGFRLSQVAVPVIIGVGAATGIPIVTSAITATI